MSLKSDFNDPGTCCSLWNRSSILNKHRVYEADCRRICWRMRENEKWRVKVFVTPPTRWDTPIYAIFRGSRSVSPLKPQFHFPRCFCSRGIFFWSGHYIDLLIRISHYSLTDSMMSDRQALLWGTVGLYCWSLAKNTQTTMWLKANKVLWTLVWLWSWSWSGCERHWSVLQWSPSLSKQPSFELILQRYRHPLVLWLTQQWRFHNHCRVKGHWQRMRIMHLYWTFNISSFRLRKSPEVDWNIRINHQLNYEVCLWHHCLTNPVFGSVCMSLNIK